MRFSCDRHLDIFWNWPFTLCRVKVNALCTRYCCLDPEICLRATTNEAIDTGRSEIEKNMKWCKWLYRDSVTTRICSVNTATGIRRIPDILSRNLMISFWIAGTKEKNSACPAAAFQETIVIKSYFQRLRISIDPFSAVIAWEDFIPKFLPPIDPTFPSKFGQDRCCGSASMFVLSKVQL